MTWAQRVRFAWVFAVASGAFGWASPQRALADDSDAGDPASRSCPDADAVWASATRLVPGAAEALRAAKPRVSIVDGGDQYRIRVTTPLGPQERTYSDPARDCAKRTRFAAEFIVLALLPPALPQEPEAGSPRGGTTTPSQSGSSTLAREGSSVATTAATAPLPAPTVSVPPAARQNEQPREASAESPSSQPVALAPPPTQEAGFETTKLRTTLVRLEASATANGAPRLDGSASVLVWGGELRVRIGSGALAGVVGVGYEPRTEFGPNGLRAALARFPTFAGVRLRAVTSAAELGVDLGLLVAIERYQGLSFHQNDDATRAAPGAAIGAMISPRSLRGFAPLVGLRCAFVPQIDDIAAAPAGAIAKTPWLWIGATVGLSFEL